MMKSPSYPLALKVWRIKRRIEVLEIYLKRKAPELEFHLGRPMMR